MKKIIVILALIFVAVLAFYLYSTARQSFVFNRPEDMAGKEASPFMPAEVKGKVAPEGTTSLKLTGPTFATPTKAQTGEEAK